MIKHFRFWCQKVLPLVYDDSLSYVEVLYKVVDYLNNLITDTNNLTEEVAELKEYVENLDVDIKDAVDSALQEMLDGGEFDEVIGAKVDEEIGDAINEVESITADLSEKVLAMPIVIGRYGRLLDNGVYGGVVSNGQGCAYDGTYYYTCGQIGGNDNQSITRFNQVGLITAYENFTQLGHANDMCYLDGKLYVANGSSAVISVVNASTLAYERAIDVSEYGGAAIGVCTDGNKLYAVLGTVNGYKFFEVGDSVTEMFTIPTKSLSPALIAQGCAVFNNHFYMAFNKPNCIYEMDSKGTLTSIYYVPDGDGYFPLGELEGFVVKDEQLLLFSTAGHGESFFSYPGLAKTYSYQLFACSIGNGNVSGVSQITAPYKLELTVSGTASVVFNPTTIFTTYEEACWIANYHGHATIKAYNIDTGLVFLENGKYSVYGPSGTRTMHNVVLLNCEAMLSQYSIREDLIAKNSNVILKNMSFNDGITAEYSTLTFIGCWLGSLTALTWTRCEFKFTDINDSVNPSATLTRNESYRGPFEYVGYCREYVIKLFKANDYPCFLSVSIPGTTLKPVSVCMTNFSAGSYATGDATFPYLKIGSDYKLYLVNASSQDILLSAQTAFMNISAV